MSTIRVSVLPEQAVAPPVVELVEATGIRSVEQWGFDTYNCGCALRHNDRHWVLCRYHDGMNDGLAMAAAPTPERCLEAALATGGHHDHGIQGGTTPKERYSS